MIKDLVVNLAQIPAKSVVMDIVVADISARFGMLLSRSWGTKIGGSIKMDLKYATIPVFGSQERRLYRETRFVKMVTKADSSENSPVYSKEGVEASKISATTLGDNHPVRTLMQLLFHL